ncbi:MAG: hypothetical protein HY304_07930 [candidate division Zixibacteria bacterium]|nr:hypothetical protein [candidate division Zixibacteria bacterium]
MKSTGHKYTESRTANMRRRMSLMNPALVTLLLILGSNVTPALSAGEDADSGKTQGAEGQKLEIPKTLPALWAAILDHQKELHEVLAAKKLEDVHHVAFAIRDYVSALPGKSANLPSEKKKGLKASVTRVGSLAKFLDEAGDAGDSAKVASLVGKLDAELKSVEALYAAKDLKPPVNAAEASKQIYVCPMHADVTSDKPGQCSKCGMALVKKSH